MQVANTAYYYYKISGKALHSRGLWSKDGGISNSAYVNLNIPHVT
jgi:hypothetical protein